jgi:metallophosphoesterase (TIGR00282 family)
MPDSQSSVNILFIGDVVGIGAHATVVRMLPTLIKKYSSDFVIVNGENIADGKSLKKQHAKELYDAGAQVITTGNHVWDRWDVKALLAEDRKVLRPANYPRENVGTGFAVGSTKSGVKVAVIDLQGRTYMQPIDDPFRVGHWAIDRVSDQTNIIIVDMHAEATAEKQAIARYLDGKVTAVLGTHTHVPTADEQILPNGTAYISDVGMSGPYESVIGMKIDIAIKRFTHQTPFKYETAQDGIRICGVSITADVETGAATSIERFTFPEFERSYVPRRSPASELIESNGEATPVSTVVEEGSND